MRAADEGLSEDQISLSKKCEQLPPNVDMGNGHICSCWFAKEVSAGTKERTGPYPAQGEAYDMEHVTPESVAAFKNGK